MCPNHQIPVPEYLLQLTQGLRDSLLPIAPKTQICRLSKFRCSFKYLSKQSILFCPFAPLCHSVALIAIWLNAESPIFLSTAGPTTKGPIPSANFTQLYTGVLCSQAVIYCCGDTDTRHLLLCPVHGRWSALGSFGMHWITFANPIKNFFPSSKLLDSMLVRQSWRLRRMSGHRRIGGWWLLNPCFHLRCWWRLSEPGVGGRALSYVRWVGECDGGYVVVCCCWYYSSLHDSERCLLNTD